MLYRAHDAVSIPVDEAIIDYRVVSEDVDDSGAVNRKILLVAAYREPIERYVDAFRQAGIQLAGIDLEGFALLRAVGPTLSDGTSADAAVVVVNAGHERTTLAVSNGSLCEFTRVLEWGGAKLASAVARELRLTTPEAETLLPTPRSAVDRPSGGQPQRAGCRSRAASPGPARELVASLEYYQAQPGRFRSRRSCSRRHEPHPGLAAELEG